LAKKTALLVVLRWLLGRQKPNVLFVCGLFQYAAQRLPMFSTDLQRAKPSITHIA